MATITFTLILASPAATGGTATPVSGLPFPVPAGTLVGNISVLPAGWNGALALSGADAALFSIGGASPNYTLLAASALTVARTYNAAITPAP